MTTGTPQTRFHLLSFGWYGSWVKSGGRIETGSGSTESSPSSSLSSRALNDRSDIAVPQSVEGGELRARQFPTFKHDLRS